MGLRGKDMFWFDKWYFKQRNYYNEVVRPILTGGFRLPDSSSAHSAHSAHSTHSAHSAHSTHSTHSAHSAHSTHSTHSAHSAHSWHPFTLASQLTLSNVSLPFPVLRNRYPESPVVKVMQPFHENCPLKRPNGIDTERYFVYSSADTLGLLAPILHILYVDI